MNRICVVCSVCNCLFWCFGFRTPESGECLCATAMHVPTGEKREQRNRATLSATVTKRPADVIAREMRSKARTSQTLKQVTKTIVMDGTRCERARIIPTVAKATNKQPHKKRIPNPLLYFLSFPFSSIFK